MDQQPRILITDDDINVRNLLTKWFEYQGFSVDEAENGRIAVEKCSREHYDVVVMDNEMPVMNGEEAIREIKAMRPTMPIVVFSGGAHIAGGYAGGQVSSVLQKPMSMTILEMEVRKAMENV